VRHALDMQQRDASPQTESTAMLLARIPATVKHAFESFLAVPTAVVAGFGLLAAASNVLDKQQPGWLAGLRDMLHAHLFADADSTTQLLTAIAGGMITLTSITFSLLLVALQQSAGSMTHAVFDQFLRRSSNQFFAGWFIGLTLYTLLTLATVSPEFNPIIGATLSLILASSALYVLLLMIYSVIEQMRPEEILQAIHDHALTARDRQLPLLRRTRRQRERHDAHCHVIRARGDGFVTAIDLDRLAPALAEAPETEVVLCLPLGGYAAFGDPLAEVRAPADRCKAIAESVERSLQVERERDLDRDAAFAIEQIETIAWSAISTSKQDPAPGREAIRNLRDLLARWVAADDEEEELAVDRLPVVYPDDVMEQLMAALESLAVASTESMQHQVFAEIVSGLAATLNRLPPRLVQRSEELILRSLAGLGDHMLTAELDRALSSLVEAMREVGLAESADAVGLARQELSASVGRLNSRGTRVPAE
jgi:uncharacterized membrane protein